MGPTARPTESGGDSSARRRNNEPSKQDRPTLHPATREASSSHVTLSVQPDAEITPLQHHPPDIRRYRGPETSRVKLLYFFLGVVSASALGPCSLLLLCYSRCLRLSPARFYQLLLGLVTGILLFYVIIPSVYIFLAWKMLAQADISEIADRYFGLLDAVFANMTKNTGTHY